MTPQRAQVLETIASRIAAVARPHPVRVAIDGVDCAGKTTLADELATTLAPTGRQIIRASVDRFLNPAAVRRRRGVLSPEGYFHDSFNYQALTELLLRPLGPAGVLHYRDASFDLAGDSALATPIRHANPDAILLMDGVFLLRPELRDYFDYSIFVRADFGVTLSRAENRDASRMGGVDGVRERYNRRYMPGQTLYLASAEPERHASLVVDNNDPESPVLVRS